MAPAIEFGLDTFGEATVDAADNRIPHAQVIRNVVEEAVLADRLGIDSFGVGEHHRDDIVISAPEVVLAAIASRTQRIRLGTAVTVLSTDEPVRVFERFATLDAVSGGRAEITLGRGSFTESCPLFGYDQGGGDLGGHGTHTAEGAAGLPEDRVRADPDLDRCRRQPGVCRPRRPVRLPAGAGDYRW
jgi:alkanesulfonate monooxygenase SsuD/methylene tetrahydromethanopterin reductase-like flavin-dependent oxidoreductase (luciferase family)